MPTTSHHRADQLLLNNNSIYTTRIFWLVTLAWLFCTTANLYLIPFLNYTDQPHYLGVAWEMFRSHQYLIPTSNSIPDNNKPPLFYWLVLGGWRIFGPNIWWPRLIQMIFAWLCFDQAARLSQKITHNTQVALITFLLAYGCYYWLSIVYLIRFDIMITFFTLFTINQLYSLSSKQQVSTVLLAALSINAGLMTKGPIILLFIIPILLLEPLFSSRKNKFTWYGISAVTLILGAIGPASYGFLVDAALKHTSIGHSAASKLSGYVSLSNLFVKFRPASVLMHFFKLLLPWALVPYIYRSVIINFKHKANDKLLFLVIPTLTCLTFFLVVTHINKSRYYLPGGLLFFILIATSLTSKDNRLNHMPTWLNTLWPNIILLFTLLLGIASQALWWQYLPKAISLTLHISPWFSLPIGGLLIYQLYCMRYNAQQQLLHTTVGTLLIWLCIQAFILLPYKQNFSLLKATDLIMQYRQRQIPILNTTDMLNKQHLEFFIRAKKTYTAMDDKKSITAWSQQHPTGRLIIATYLVPEELFKYHFDWTIVSNMNSPPGDMKHHLFLIGLCPSKAYLHHRCPPIYKGAHT